MSDEETREVVALLYNAIVNLANQSQNYNGELEKILKEVHKIIVPPKESDSEDNIIQYEKSGYRYFGCEKCGKVVHLDHLREHICNNLPRTKKGKVVCNGCGRELDHYHYYSPCPICGYNPLEKKFLVVCKE